MVWRNKMHHVSDTGEVSKQDRKEWDTVIQVREWGQTSDVGVARVDQISALAV